MFVTFVSSEYAAASALDFCITSVFEEAEAEFSPLALIYPKEVPVFEKYDEYVPAELIVKGFALGVLDTQGMKQRVLSWKKFI